jgi:hypothetical protein
MSTVTRALHPVRELDSRESDGLVVTLLWNSATDHLWVRVDDGRSGASFDLEAQPDRALDVFHHPYSYMRRAA